MYVRGGKVWTGNNGRGLVFLERDWTGDRLPEDLVEEAGLLGTNFKLLKSSERAQLAGYSIEDQNIKFVIDPDQVANRGNNPSFFLAFENNHWLRQENCNFERWQLRKDDSGLLSLLVPLTDIIQSKEFSFKFKSSDEHWINPPDFIPCQEQTMPGAPNFLFHLERTGRDILSFELIERENPNPLAKWISTYPQNLGFTQIKDKGVFRLFAPRAKEVFLCLGLDFDKPVNTLNLPMKLLEDGVWEVRTKEGLSQKTYFYEVVHPPERKGTAPYRKRILDPYAKACCGREGPGLIRTQSSLSNKLSKTFLVPEAKDLVIVEAHVRDLLKKAPCKLKPSARLEFSGLTAWLNSEDCYLRKLGANAIELQPVHQFDSRSKEEYHWGYMPINYFSPAAEYASCPSRAGHEFHGLVESFHQAGMAVILDVVYNHMGIPNHLLNLDRELYLQTDNLGRLTNHSGCGNDLRCEAGPVKKLIIDSLKHWVLEYGVDGFRFDLGELLGLELLQEIEIELKELNPKIVLIAEPWSFRGRLPEKMNQTGYSLWSDRCRESLLSFVKGEGEIEKIRSLIMGKLDHENIFPWQSIHYTESHDDYAFIDRICSGRADGGIIPAEDAVKQAQLAMFILFISPGIPMISAGQDFLRSKKGIRNTYQHEIVNALDYSRLSMFKGFRDEIRALIKFRLSSRGLFSRPGNFDDCQYENIGTAEGETLSLAIQHKSLKEDFLVLCNPTNKKMSITLPDQWQVHEIVFPLESQSTPFSFLEPFGYRLLAKKI